jgi:2-alkenal reductase
VIAEVARGTPAAGAGLQPLNRRTGDLGDVIVAVNGRSIETLSTFVAELDRAGIEAQVELTVRRAERERKVKLRVIDLRE